MSIGLTKEEIIKRLDKSIIKDEHTSASMLKAAIAEVIVDNNKVIEKEIKDLKLKFKD